MGITVANWRMNSWRQNNLAKYNQKKFFDQAYQRKYMDFF